MTGTGSERLPARSTATSVSPVVGDARRLPRHAQLPRSTFFPLRRRTVRAVSLTRSALHAVHSGNGLEDPDARGRRIDEDRIRMRIVRRSRSRRTLSR